MRECMNYRMDECMNAIMLKAIIHECKECRKK
jgi:hypothetical protein